MHLAGPGSDMKKTIVVLLVFTLVLLILFVSAPLISLYSFESIEQQEITRDVRQALNILNEDLRQLNTVADDYAGWDDAYAFVQGKNPRFIEKNIGEPFYNKLKLNIFMIINDANAIVYQHAYDYNNKTTIPLPASFLEHLSSGKPLLWHTSIKSFTTGLLSLPEGILLVVSRPILTSQYQGPIKGSMVFGRFLDSEELGRLAKMIQLRLKVIDMAEVSSTPALRSMMNNFPGTDAVHLRVEGEELIAAYTPLKDIYGKDAGILKVENTRQIYLHAKDFSRRFFILYSASATAFLIVLILLGRKLIIFRRYDQESRKALVAKQMELEALNDTLERRIAEEVELNRKKDRLMIHQGRLAAMGEMIGNIAHQWRQPLNRIGLVVQRIELEYELGGLSEESVKAMVSECMEYALYMSNTIDDFRNFFTPEQEQTSFSLNDAINRGLSLIRASVENKNIALSFQEDCRCMLTGHANVFTQAILNLVNNSIDALLAHKPPEPFIKIHCFHSGNRSVVTVSDNAGGIGEPILNKIFDPYFTTKYKSLGTGIGLYMSKMIIENNMGGSLSVRNIEGGAEFIIELDPSQNNGLRAGEALSL